MGYRGIKRNLAWPFTAATLLALIHPAFAETLTGGVAAPTKQGQSEQTEVREEDTPGFIRNHTWSGSFDRAGDATRAAELELKSGNIECKEENFQTQGATPEIVSQRMNDCLALQKQAQGFAKDAESIRKTQRVLAHVSRASDVAAVGAIGAIGYSELIKKDKSQASSLEGVAKIQETAGYVSYTTGAADISMGAYALTMQKSKLEKMKKALTSASKNGMQLSTADSAMVSKITKAAEQTKKAAYSHMAYGAGKVAVGYASMQLAEKNRKIAESLTSLDTSNATGTVAAPYVYKGASGSVYYQNNDAKISVPNGTSSTDPLDGVASAESYAGAGGGASVMPGDSRFPASAGKSGLGGGSAIGGAGGAKSGGAETVAPEALAAVEEGKAAPAGSGDLTIPGGGGGSRYGGGSSSSAEEAAPVAQVLDSANAQSSGTGVNPNSIYQDAIEGTEGQEEGSMAGVSGSGQSLFMVIKVKYNKMMEVGRLQGPGAVEVRN